MNISQFIRENEELRELPFMVVYKTIWFLQIMGKLKEDFNVDRVSQ